MLPPTASPPLRVIELLCAGAWSGAMSSLCFGAAKRRHNLARVREPRARQPGRQPWAKLFRPFGARRSPRTERTVRASTSQRLIPWRFKAGHVIPLRQPRTP